MKEFEKLKREDEEFRMFREWANELSGEINQAWESGKKISVQTRSGCITQSVIRRHLKLHSFTVSQNRVRVDFSKTKWHLLVLKDEANGIDSDKDNYSSDEVHSVLEIRANAVADVVQTTKKRFQEIKNKVNCFAVVVLSERQSYPLKYTPKNTQNLFTLIFREKRLPKLNIPNVDIPAIVEAMRENGELWKTGDWSRLIASLNLDKT